MNVKLWPSFWRELVRQKKRKLELPSESVDNFLAKEKLVTRSIDYDRKQKEERTIRLFRVVRILRSHGFTVERHGQLFVIKDATTKRI